MKLFNTLSVNAILLYSNIIYCTAVSNLDRIELLNKTLAYRGLSTLPDNIGRNPISRHDVELLAQIINTYDRSNDMSIEERDLINYEILNYIEKRDNEIKWSNNPYAPKQVNCPSNSLIRAANSISTNESDYINSYRPIANEALISFLNTTNLTTINNFNIENFVNNNNITIGLAFSGGGYRAMLNGAGELAALDNRTPRINNTGSLSGLLQASTYIVGLSGGNWLVNSVVVNNFSSIQDLIASDSVWNLDDDIVSPYGSNVIKNGLFWTRVKSQVDSKEDEGFQTTITDYWGRALSNQLFNISLGGPDFSYSDIRNIPPFVNHQMPFPIVVSDSRYPNLAAPNASTPVFEYNPFEFGSWDSEIYTFYDIKYAGSSVNNGKPYLNYCISGFDNAGFIMGTSSSLFNQALVKYNETNSTSVFATIINSLLSSFDTSHNDISAFYPNPFNNSQYAGDNTLTDTRILNMVDGGEDGQNVPFFPLIQPERNVDVILAFDNSADTDYSWSNGTSIVATYERQAIRQSNGTSFPYVPDQNTIINNGLNKRPVFFGCSRTNLTGDINAPLVVYFNSYPYSGYSNFSTFKMSYKDSEVQTAINNAYNVATQGNGTFDSEWPTCLACAIIQRSLERNNATQPDVCKSCFTKYCWDGSLNSSTPAASLLNPLLKLTGENVTTAKKKSFGVRTASSFFLSYGNLLGLTFLVAVFAMM